MKLYLVVMTSCAFECVCICMSVYTYGCICVSVCVCMSLYVRVLGVYVCVRAHMCMHACRTCEAARCETGAEARPMKSVFLSLLSMH